MRYVVFLLMLFPQLLFAFSWQDLWLTPNQQGAKLLREKQPKAAAKHFENPLWQGVSNYRAGDYDKAIGDFATLDTPLANYNRGNALAKSGQYQAAIQAYDKAIKQQPDFDDAVFNKKLVEKLLKQQKKESSQSNQAHQKQQSGKQKQNNTQAKNKQQSDSKKQAGQKNQNHQQSQRQKQNPSQQQNNQQAQHRQQQNNQQQGQHRQTQHQDNQKTQRDQQQHQQSQRKQGQQGHAAKQNQQNQQSTASNKTQHLSKKQQQSLKQWLQQIPDNPGGLLRQKFMRDHLRLQQQRH